MITFLTWLWRQPKARSQYGIEHVGIWAAMLRRHLSIPHRLACVTDFDGLPSHIERIEPPRDFEDWRIPSWGEERPQCLRRIAMFAPNAAEIFGERFVCMDLDVAITGDLAPMISGHEFRIAKGTAPSRPYNGSMMLIEAGKRSQVYKRFSPTAAAAAGQRFLGSDQAWISYCLGPHEATWTEADGLGWHGLSPPANPRVIFFPGSTKPWDVIKAGANSKFERHYKGERSDRVLLLGYGKNLWLDVERALAQPFAAVIASPEAAEYWPGPILEIADDDRQAVRLAKMHGFSELAFCGMEAAA